MSPTIWFILTLLILLLGLIFVWIANKPDREIPPPAETANMGYGMERWQRELSLWRGVLRRLEIQAKYQSPNARLQQEIDEAKAKIAEAEHHLL